MKRAMLFTALLVSVLAVTPAKKPYSVEEQVRLKRILQFELSPDGSQVAFTLRTTDYEANRGRTDLWRVGVDGSGLRQLTSHPEADSDVRFAPDGKSLFFLSGRTGTQQVFRLSLEGGEPVQLTNSPIDVGAFVLSRDGAKLAFSAEVFPGCDLACTQKRLDEKARSKASGKLYDSLFVRHWDSFGDGRRSHLFVMPVAGGAPVDVMKAMDADAPSKPFGGAEEFTFTPDGKQLVFTARDVGREEAWSTDLDLFVTAVDGSGAPKKLTTANRATDTQPVFSPDGKTLAYAAMKRPGFEADKLTVVLRDWATGAERALTGGWDRSADVLRWSADGKSLLVTADELGQHKLFAFDVAAPGAPKVLVAQGTVSGVAVAGEKVVVAVNDLKRPNELFLLQGTALKAITQVNAEALAGVLLGEPEQFDFAGANGDRVYAYLVKPVGFDAKKKYPLAFLIHGGPQGSFGNDFHYRWNPQPYAARGYAVVMIDFHGSTGYGQAFTDSISNDWGGKPLEDLQKGLAAALEKYPFLDKARVCALGASYGGYMVNYLAGVWNAPFACLVTHDGNLDERMAYYDTEELWFPEWEHGGTPWEKPEGYAKHNPIDHVSAWKVPTLVIHGGKDYRVVDTQGLSTFTVLQRRGIPSKLLYFPDENHWVLKPQNSVLWHQTVLDWLDQWTRTKK